MNATTTRLVHMANQIARVVRNRPPAQAVASTFDHLCAFWDPRMRWLIVQYARAGGGGLDTIALSAVERLADGAGLDRQRRTEPGNVAGQTPDSR